MKTRSLSLPGFNRQHYSLWLTALLSTALLLISFPVLSTENSDTAQQPTPPGLYKWVDKEGNINYSDEPPFEDAEALDPPQLSTTPAIKPVKKPVKTTDSREQRAFRYTLFNIQSPSQEETIRDNQGNVSISMAIKPALNIKLGHSITIILDGQPVNTDIKSSSSVLNNVDRGSHTVSAIIKDRSGKVLKRAAPVTLYLHRMSILHKRSG